MPSRILDVNGLTRTYGPRRGITDMTFSLRRGEVVGLLGRNGAGKTTALRVLAGILWPTAGTVSVCGHDVTRGIAARGLVGYMPEQPALYPEATVADYLAFVAGLRGVRRRGREAAVELALERGAVADVAGRMIGRLSKGYRQRIALAAAIVHDPPLLLLDEPTAGLDPAQVVDTRALIRDLAADRTVLLSTHVLGEVTAIATRALFIDDGRLVADRDVGDLRRAGTPEEAFLAILRGRA